jgi:putative aminopeptidase FrvX
MHSPNEMIDLADVDHAARLIAAFASSIASENEFLPE